MLKKRERLTKKEFDRFFAAGRRHHSPLIQLIHAPHAAFHGAAVAGKKVSKKAVERNRARRRIYAVLYALKREHDLTGVYILIAKPRAGDASYAELKADIAALVGRTAKAR